jgi:hypothetical protein
MLFLMHSLFCGLMAWCQVPPHPSLAPPYRYTQYPTALYTSTQTCTEIVILQKHGDSALLSNLTSLILCEISCTAPAVHVASREVESEYAEQLDGDTEVFI